MARKKKAKGRGRTGLPAPIPTPEEIRARAAEIQAGWSDAERLKRAGLSAQPWEPPTMNGTPHSQHLDN